LKVVVFYREFINDKDQDEMSFPAYNLSVGEIACMMEKAIDLVLSCKEIGSVSTCMTLAITKDLKKHGEKSV